jgi:hypothetical protein
MAAIGPKELSIQNLRFARHDARQERLRLAEEVMKGAVRKAKRAKGKSLEKARKRGPALEGEPWKAEGISRRTWFRRKAK